MGEPDRTGEQPPPCPHCGREDWKTALGQDFAVRAARRRRQGLSVAVISCLALIPWIVYLATSLPVHYEARQWRFAWVGFDIALLLLLAATAWCGWRRLQLVVPLALATGVLMLCDVWFDVMLAWGTDDLWLSLASAFLVELPLAGLLLNRSRTLMDITLKAYWYRAGIPGSPPPLHRAALFVDPGHAEASRSR